MKYTMLVALGLLSACFTFLACSGDEAPVDSPAKTPRATMKSRVSAKADTPKDVGNQLETPINDTRFHAKLKEIVGEYKYYAVTRFGYMMPEMCSMPPPEVVTSQAESGEHKKKVSLYFAKDPATYNVGRLEMYHHNLKRAKHQDLGGDVASEQKDGQVIVKEALALDEHGNFSQYSDRSPGRLFIMMKLDPKTEGTDKGWVYGIIEPDKTITASGRIKSCMGCHRGAAQDRVFGLRNAITATRKFEWGLSDKDWVDSSDEKKED